MSNGPLALSAKSNRSSLALTAVAAALLLAPLAALAPAASAAPSTLTTLADGGSSASLYFPTCGAERSGGAFSLPFDAVVERMEFSLRTTGNTSGQSGYVRVYIGGHEGPVANLTVDTVANATVSGEAFNAYLHASGATSGNVSVPIAFVGCSNMSEWWVQFDNIQIIYRQPTDMTLSVISPASAVVYVNNSSFMVFGTVSPADCSVYVNEEAAIVDDTGAFYLNLHLAQGENLVRVSVCANYGMETVDERVVVLDEGTVSLAIDWPPHEYVTNQTSLTIRGQTDAGAWVTVNGENATMNATTGQFELTVQLEDLYNQTENVFEIVARDIGGNERRVNITVICDTHAPTLDLDLAADLAAAIANGTNISSHEATIAGHTDSSDARIQINGHNVTLEALHFSAGVALSQGRNDVTITATDRAGNSRSVTLTIWADITAPEITLTLDANLSAAIEAGTAVHNHTVDIRGYTDSNDTAVVINEHTADRDGLNFNRTVELHDGENVVTIVAEDHAGNRREVHLTIFADLSVPGLSVRFDNETRAAMEHHKPVNRSTVTASVESNASTVRFYLNEQLMSQWEGSTNIEATLSEGDNLLLFEAVEGDLVARTEFHITLDTVAPYVHAELNGTTDENGTTVSHTRLLAINGTTEAGARVMFCTAGAEANGTEWCHEVDVFDNGNFHGSVELSADAENHVRVVATDAAGNTAQATFVVVYEVAGFSADTALGIHIGGTHEGTIYANSSLVFEVSSEVALPDGAQVAWYVDGELVGTGHRIDGVNLTEGNHTIEVQVAVNGTVASTSSEVHVAAATSLPPTVNGGASLLLPLMFLGLAAAGATVASTERGRYFLLAALMGSVFTRLKKPAPLDHFVRGRLYQLISDEPGVHYAELRRRANLSNGAAAHHLRVLETAGIVRVVVDGTRTRFYATDKPLEKESYGLSDGDRAVLDNVTQAPGITESELSVKVDRSLSTVSRSVERLAALGYVSTSRQGRTVSVFPRAGDEVPAALGKSPWPTDEA